MCGIVGILGRSDVADCVIDGLSRLEYRGYNSAGIALMDSARRVSIRRSVGQLSALRDNLDKAPVSGLVGIGHTRWATHGHATEANARGGSADIKTTECGEVALPFVYAVVAQMLAYHVARAKGTNVDRPRSRAQSVTVERSHR